MNKDIEAILSALAECDINIAIDHEIRYILALLRGFVIRCEVTR